MSKSNARHAIPSRGRPRLTAVEWSVPSTEPDTSSVDDSWGDGPRHSFIALKAAAEPLLAYDVWESPHALLVLVDLPGVEAEQVSLSMGSQALYLEVNVPPSHEVRSGVAPGHYEVRVDAPAGAGPDAIDASLKNGLLRIRISKDGTGARRVAIVCDDPSE